MATREHTEPTYSDGEQALAEYVYGVTWAASAIEARSGGVADAAVSACRFRELAALTSAVDAATLRPRKRDLTRHADVLAAAFRDGTVVPLRFGTVFRDGDAVVGDLLEPRYEQLTRLLRTLEGRGELRVSAFYDEEAILREVVARDATIARLREQTRTQQAHAARGLRLELGERVAAALAAWADNDAQRLVRRLAQLAVDVTVEERLNELQVVRASFLVDLRNLGSFDAEMDDLARREAGRMRLKYVGPLPPHSFVSLQEAV